MIAEFCRNSSQILADITAQQPQVKQLVVQCAPPVFAPGWRMPEFVRNDLDLRAHMLACGFVVFIAVFSSKDAVDEAYWLNLKNKLAAAVRSPICPDAGQQLLLLPLYSDEPDHPY